MSEKIENEEPVVTLEPFPTVESAKIRLSKAELDESALVLFDAAEGELPGGSLVAAASELVSAGMPVDAVRVLSQALTRKASAWWACRAARLEVGGGVTQQELPALEAAEAWVRNPVQEKAYAAQAISSEIGLASPAGCAALAAFLSGTSLAPPHLDPLPPPPHLAGMAVAGAVRLAAERRQPSEADSQLLHLIKVGLAIAAGEDGWDA